MPDIPTNRAMFGSTGTGDDSSPFRQVPESQLASMEKLPFLRQRFGYAVAEVGAAALSQKYPAGWARPRRRAWCADRGKTVTAAPGVIS